jgi:Mg-chelatase subunit ChlD
MEKHCICILAGVIFPFLLRAQNLVPNPSFESDTTVPICTWPVQNEPGTILVDGWSSPTRATADYFNSDLSFIDFSPLLLARSGQGRMAVICGLGQQLPESRNYKEYVQCQLLQPLESGKTYRVSFHIALDRAANYTANGIGVLLSEQPLMSQSKERLREQPQIRVKKLITPKDGWVEVEGFYKANGGESYLTFGSFSDTTAIPLWKLDTPSWMGNASNHIRRGAYIYLDDVCVAEKTSKGCDCNLKASPEELQTNSATGSDYYLFVLDASRSMKNDNKFKILRQQIVHFAERLNQTDHVAVMTFSQEPVLHVPFLSKFSAEKINRILRRIRPSGPTNGDQALQAAAKLLDTFHRPERLHLILLTDGQFPLSQQTEKQVDSVLHRQSCSLQVLFLGTVENTALIRLAVKQINGRYEQTTLELLPALLEAEQPAPSSLPPPPTELKINKLQYTNMRQALARMSANLSYPGY